jgi:hypothetical protein
MEIYQAEETRDKVDYGPLLFTNRDVTVYDYPFSRGCIDNYLPDQIYQELLKAFPTEAIHINYTADATLDSENPRLKDFWSQNPIRKSLLDFLLPGHFSVTYKKFMMPVILAIAVMLIGETGIT